MTAAISTVAGPAATTKPHRRGPGWVKLAVAAVVLFGAGDLIFTLYAMTGPGMLEANPLARLLVHQGIAAIVVFKLTVIGVNACPLWIWRSRPIAQVASLASLLIMSWLMFRWAEWFLAWQAIGPDAWSILADDPRWIRL